MSNCREFTELAPAFLEGGLDPATRQGLAAHLATCPGCLAWSRQLGVVARAAALLPPPESPPELERALLRRFDAWQAGRAAGEPVARAGAAPGGADRHPWEGFFALAGLVALLVGLARHPSRAAADWAVAALLAASAVALAALARRLTLRFGAAALSAALVAAALRGGAGPLAFPAGLECLLTEVGAAAGAMAVAFFALRRRPAPAVLGAWAVAGALAGDSALQITCGAHGSLPHLAAFHAGGVLAVALLAAVAARLRRQAA